MKPPSTEPPPEKAWFIEPPIPPAVQSLLIFGGAFDPPHLGHVELPALMRDRIGADWLLYVPAARTPLKSNQPAAPAEDRLAMLRLAIQGRPRASVTDVEIRRGGLSYTLDTLIQLRSRLPEEVRFRLLIGADQAAAFHRWREPQQVIAMAEPVVMLRPPDESADELLARLERHWSQRELEEWKNRIIEAPVTDASSTNVRRLIREEGAASEALTRLTPPTVLEYIHSHRLYEAAKEQA